MALIDETIFSEMDIDTIGEILNISMGTAATTLSEMLEQKVSITTPVVQVIHSSKIEIKEYEPAIGVEINYVQGLTGKNILVMKENDIKVIVGLLLHSEDMDKEFVLDEMSIGAICEVMNQMMGSSSTALAQFLGRAINISPPSSFKLEDNEQLKHRYFDGEVNAVMVHFHLTIGDLVKSKFVSVMTVELAKELASSFHFSSSEPLEPQAPTAPAPVAPTPVRAAYAEPPTPKPAAPKAAPDFSIARAPFPSFDTEESSLTDDQSSNLNLIMSVALQISVEIGRTTRKIKDILDFSTGTIVELDKQAGSQVDIFVNGKAIAKGDVVVIDDYYGVRVTEVLSNSEIMKLV